MNKTVRKLIIWGLILIVGLPNIILGEPGYKLVGLVIITGLIWWDVAASKKGSRKKKV